MSLDAEDLSALFERFNELVRRMYPPLRRQFQKLEEQYKSSGTIDRGAFIRLKDYILRYKERDPRGIRYRNLDETLEILETIGSSVKDANMDKIKNNILTKIQTKKGKIKIVFFFGSGASRPPPSNIPVVNEMLEYLVRNLPPTEMPFSNKMREWAKDENINIEDILTAGYISTLLVGKPNINKLVGEIIYREIERPELELRDREYVHSFQDLLNRVFSMISGLMAKAESNDIHEKVVKFINKNTSDHVEMSIVTTNYDICIEKACKKVKVKYKYLGIDDHELLEAPVTINKIHGSINWFYCEGCQNIITYTMDEVNSFSKIYPTSGSCQECGTAASQFMVPPIAYKYVMYPPLIDIWKIAMDTIENADIIIPIGYSFSLSDDYIFQMIVSSMKKNGSLVILLNRSISSLSNINEKLLPHHLIVDNHILDDALNSCPEILNTLVECIKENKDKENEVEKEE